VSQPDSPDLPNIYKCSSCSKEFGTEELFQLHYRLHHNPTTCQICNKTYRGTTKLQEHIRAVHPETRGSFRCQPCGKDLPTAYSLARHKSTYHSNHQFKCPDSNCTASFKVKHHLTDHVASLHPSQSFTCSHCGVESKTRKRLLAHIRNKHPNEYSKTAGKERANQAGLPNRPHHCSKCSASFTSSANLSRHLATVHGPKTIPCLYCKMRFSHQRYLKAHMDSEHGKEARLSQQQR